MNSFLNSWEIPAADIAAEFVQANFEVEIKD